MDSPNRSKLFYGYYIVGANFIVLFFLWGMVLNAFPVFVKPMSDNMGWTRQDLPIASMMGAIGSIFVLPIAGKLIDRVGARPVMMAGTVLIGIPMILGGFITEFWHLCVIFFFIGCGMAGATIIPSSFVISNWFVARRGTALSLAFMGTAFGGMVMAPVASWIIRTFSWRAAFIAGGIEVLVIVLPIIYFVIRNHPSEMGLEPYGSDHSESESVQEIWGVNEKEAMTVPAFWLIGAIMLIGGLVTGGVGYHCVAYLQDLGHDSARASLAWGLVMGIMILGKLATGPIADRWGSKGTMAGAYVVFCVSILLLAFAKSYSLVLVFAAIYGFSLGAPLILNPLLIGHYLGMKNFGAIFGILSILGTIGGAAGPIIVGNYHKNHGTYLPVFYAFAVLVALGAFCSAVIKPIPRQVGATGESRPAEVSG